VNDIMIEYFEELDIGVQKLKFNTLSDNSLD
jgi:hypothetical protein